jgi:type III secretory pathway lipoprotein EscJ|tara:strand:- start:1159 stop:1452 length:294 start_codon:yes stop_codon:yes gene_type:complete
MIKGTKTVTTNGFTFEYIPSMRVLGVTSPTGGVEIHHQLSYEQANEIQRDVLERNNIMVDENQNENENQAEEVSAEDWNAACDHWDMLHDLHGLQGF